MTIAVPTLGTTTFLTDATDIVPYVIRHYAAAPKSTTHVWTDEAISLRDTLTRFGNDRQNVREPISQELSRVFNRIFGNSSTNVSVTIEDVEGLGLYNIVLEVTVFQNGTPFTLSDIIFIDDGVPVVNNEGAS